MADQAGHGDLPPAPGQAVNSSSQPEGAENGPTEHIPEDPPEGADEEAAAQEPAASAPDGPWAADGPGAPSPEEGTGYAAPGTEDDWAPGTGAHPWYDTSYAPSWYADDVYEGDPTARYGHQLGYEETIYDEGTEAYRQRAIASYETGSADDSEGRYWDEETEGQANPTRRGRRRGNGPWPELVMVTAVAVVVAAVVLAVTTADVSRQGTTAPTSAPAQTTPPTRPASSTTRPTSTTTKPTSTTTTVPASAHAVNLLASAAVKAALVKSWLASDPGGVGLGPRDVNGTAPGEVYYGEQPVLKTYWALAAFQPAARITAEASTAAGQAKLSQFQGNVYVFSSHNSSSWTVLGVVSPRSCPGDWVPRPVLAIWGLCGLHP